MEFFIQQMICGEWETVAVEHGVEDAVRCLSDYQRNADLCGVAFKDVVSGFRIAIPVTDSTVAVVDCFEEGALW